MKAKTLINKSIIFCLIFHLMAPTFSFAAEGPQTFTYQGRLLSQDGSGPIADQVNLTLSIYSSDGSCLLYKEKQNLDLTQTDGVFSVQVGSNQGSPKRPTDDPGFSMAQIFANTGSFSSSSSCPNGYSPAANDSRKLRVSVSVHGGVSVALSPDLTLASVPTALVAETLQGKKPEDFVQKSSNITQSSLEILTNSSDASDLHNHDSLYVKLGSDISANKVTINGTPQANTDAVSLGVLNSKLAAKQDSLGYSPVNKAGDTMSGPLTLAGTPSQDSQAANKVYVDSQRDQAISVSQANIATAVAGKADQSSVDSALALKADKSLLDSKLNVSGGTLSGNLALGGNSVTGVADPQQLQDAATKSYVDNKVLNSVPTGVVKADGSVPFTGPVAFNEASDSVGVTVKGSVSQSKDLTQWQDNSGTTVAKVDKTGNLSAKGISTQTISVTGGSPASGKVLTSDGSGVGTWQSLPASNAGTVTNVSGSAPISVVNGSSTPSISIASATASSDGYLKSSDFSLFSSKENALTFSSPLQRTGTIISVQSASSSQPGVLSASDYAAFNAKLDSTLGQGNIFVGNSSGKAVAVAMSGDATMNSSGAVTLKNTGTAGTYTKVTTDVQGRVSSGAALSASDIPSLPYSQITSTGASLGQMLSADGSGGWNWVSSSTVAAAMPAGTIIEWAGNACPNGYLAADGSSYSKTLYPTLFAALTDSSTGKLAWGGNASTAAASTSFNVPDLRGRFVRGVDTRTSGQNDPDNASRTASATNGNAGATVGSVEADQFASHTHNTNTYNVNNSWFSNSGNNNQGVGWYTGTAIVSGATGGNETRPKNAFVSFCIATGIGGTTGVDTPSSARYYASNTSISSSLTTIVWTTKDWDTHGAMSSGIYTCPSAGKYQYSLALGIGAASTSVGNSVDIQVQKNGTAVSENFYSYRDTTSYTIYQTMSDTISCNQNDTIRVQVSSNASSPVIATSNTRNFFSIIKVSN